MNKRAHMGKGRGIQNNPAFAASLNCVGDSPIFKANCPSFPDLSEKDCCIPGGLEGGGVAEIHIEFNIFYNCGSV